MRLRLLKLAGLLTATTVLAACGSGGGDGGATVVTPAPPAAPAPLEDMFGLGFGATFRLAGGGDAREPATGDLNPVSFTTDPIPVP